MSTNNQGKDPPKKSKSSPPNTNEGKGKMGPPIQGMKQIEPGVYQELKSYSVFTKKD